LNTRLLLGSNSETSGETVDMSVLDDGVAVLFGLSRDLLALADAHILDETAFEVLLEELPDLLSD
jgi:hypothetical protein